MDEREEGARLARVAAAIADGSRATMLLCLLDGNAWTAAELADHARIARSTATGHLNALHEAGLVNERRAGRHRYVTIAGGEVVRALEALSAFAIPSDPRPSLRSVHADRALRRARSCYDHLAGELGTRLMSAWVAKELLEIQESSGMGAAELAPQDRDRDRSRVQITLSGEEWFGGLGIDLAELGRARRPLAFTCLDWTQRRDHLAGALGAAFMERAQDLGWIQRRAGTRIVRVSEPGERALLEQLGVELTELSLSA